MTYSCFIYFHLLRRYKRKLCKALKSSLKYYFAMGVFKVTLRISNRTVCKIGLKTGQGNMHPWPSCNRLTISYSLSGSPNLALLRLGFL